MKPDISAMTLREKLGQTCFPSPNALIAGVKRFGGYKEYYSQYPFTGLYCFPSMESARFGRLDTQYKLRAELNEAQRAANIPLLVSCDAELGARELAGDLHAVPSMMSVGAAGSKELAHKRGYYYARELKSLGINWPFGPMGDILGNFFSVSGIRCMSDRADLIVDLYPDCIRGMQRAGVAATAKHFPDRGADYRDSHFCSSKNLISMDEWNATSRKVWRAAVDAGAMSFMIGHTAFIAADPSRARGNIPRPASASKKVLNILRAELGFNGVVVTDAVGMKCLAAAFEHDDIYIECFNAGNDIILFCHDDYLDVMEKAVNDGRVSMERVNESVERVLKLKTDLGLFETTEPGAPLTPEENAIFDNINYEIGKKAITLINNARGIIPFKQENIKRATIIGISPHAPFMDELKVVSDALNQRGIHVTLLNGLKSKAELKALSQSEDMIIYACFLAQSRPKGMSFYSRPEDMNTLFNSLSYGTEKSVVVSFGAPSIYYNYFEQADAYINAYSSDAGTMRAFVDGILGEFAFTGISPVKLAPEFA